MYFFTNQGMVCHILEDEESGKAPAPCGAKLTRLERLRLYARQSTNMVLAEKPSDRPLCKHCQKAFARENP